MVTNNEVSEDEAKGLIKKGLQPGDTEYEQMGIAQYVTWPRTVGCILGKDVNGNDIEGSYLGSDKPMSEGFRTNAAFFRLGFLNKTAVALGRQTFGAIPTLMAKSWCSWSLPYVEGDKIHMKVLPENQFAILYG